ncbi:MAG: endonuclease III [Desulfuromonas sp.]
MKRENRTAECLVRLKAEYPQAKCSLNYTCAFELLIATILSAQTTDARVNLVTPELFRKYPHPAAYTPEEQGRIENIIRSIGCYKTKTTRIIDTAARLISTYGGQVPASMEELCTLPGVGRKTANVVLSNIFNIPGFAVDTHVKRVSYRIGLTHKTDPAGVEQDLCALTPPASWGAFSHLLIYHGRAVCKARTPLCEACVLYDICMRCLQRPS